MKTYLNLSLLFMVFLQGAAAGREAPAPVMRDAATHQQLTLTYRKAAQADPMRKFKAAEGEDPSVVNQPKDLISRSDVICFGRLATLVPKRAILNLPENMKDRLKFRPGCKVRTWMDFYSLNRGWITTVEVSRLQAEGNEAFAEELADRVRKSRNLVVATFQGGPISVLPLKEQKEVAVQK